jgi:excisionase family DNA binding protein
MAYNPPSLPVQGNEGDLLTPAEVAAVFRVDPKTVTRWAAAGRITSIRTPGGHRRFRRSEVDRLLADDETPETLSRKPVNPLRPRTPGCYVLLMPAGPPGRRTALKQEPWTACTGSGSQDGMRPAPQARLPSRPWAPKSASRAAGGSGSKRRQHSTPGAASGKPQAAPFRFTENSI